MKDRITISIEEDCVRQIRRAAEKSKITMSAFVMMRMFDGQGMLRPKPIAPIDIEEMLHRLTVLEESHEMVCLAVDELRDGEIDTSIEFDVGAGHDLLGRYRAARA